MKIIKLSTKLLTIINWIVIIDEISWGQTSS